MKGEFYLLEMKLRLAAQEVELARLRAENVGLYVELDYWREGLLEKTQKRKPPSVKIMPHGCFCTLDGKSGPL